MLDSITELKQNELNHICGGNDESIAEDTTNDRTIGETAKTIGYYSYQAFAFLSFVAVSVVAFGIFKNHASITRVKGKSE